MILAARLLSALGIALAALPAWAEAWRIDSAASSLAIVYFVDGQERQGGFTRFSGVAEFDAAALETADLSFDIETASIDVGEPFGTQFVKSIDWLFVEEHPVAQYRLIRLERIEGDRYRAFGDLSLRGETRAVEGELSIALAKGEASAVGEARFDRKDFGVGVGFSALFVEIGPEIRVAFDLVARPAR